MDYEARKYAFDQAVREAAAVIPERINTAGMYDRQQREKDAKNGFDAAASDRKNVMNWAALLVP